MMERSLHKFTVVRALRALGWSYPLTHSSMEYTRHGVFICIIQEHCNWREIARHQ